MKTEKLYGKRLRCYDNGGPDKGGTCDRFTVVYLDEPERKPGSFAAVGMNGSPFHPQGFGQHCTAMPGRHLGKRVALTDLPEDCQKVVRQDLKPLPACDNCGKENTSHRESNFCPHCRAAYQAAVKSREYQTRKAADEFWLNKPE